MPPKWELSQGQIEEIRALRGQLSAAEAKKRFGIGSTRLHGATSLVLLRNSLRPSSFGSASAPQCTKPLALRRSCKATTTSPEADCRRLLQNAGRTRVPTRALYEIAGPVGKQQRPRRLSRRAGGYCEGTSHHSVETRRHAGGGPPRADRDQDGQMVETAQKWTYISLAAILVWKVVGATWKRCTPVAVGRDVVQQQEKQGHTAAPPPPPVVAEQRAKPGDPFYMAG